MKTPNTLHEAIEVALSPDPLMNDKAYNVLKDFIAQKVSISYFEIARWRKGGSVSAKTPEDILEALFDRLTKVDKKDEQ